MPLQPHAPSLYAFANATHQPNIIPAQVLVCATQPMFRCVALLALPQTYAGLWAPRQLAVVSHSAVHLVLVSGGVRPVATPAGPAAPIDGIPGLPLPSPPTPPPAPPEFSCQVRAGSGR